jgi:propanediol dehydratase small subunit
MAAERPSRRTPNGTPGRREPPSRGRADRRAERGRQPDRGDRPIRPQRRPPVHKPSLPADLPRIRRDVHADLRAATAPGQLNDVVRAYASAGEALEADDVPRATELLEWAKTAAGRSAAVREALGIARYLAGDFEAAHAELLAYRRISGRQDQNHLLADCARATGRDDKVAAYVREMDPAAVPPDRWAEGLIVLASYRAAAGDYAGALAVLNRADLDPDRVEPYHPRLWYVAGDIAERTGDTDLARDYFEAIAAVEEDFLDVEERLAALEG